MMDDPHSASESLAVARATTRPREASVDSALDRAPRDVVVVGGGFIGMAAAAALADGRRRVVVLEARSGADPRFRGELIHPHGAEILRALGLHSALMREGAAPVRGFGVHGGSAREAIRLPYPDAREGLAMDHRHMVATLRREVATLPRVEIRTGARVSSVLRRRGRICGVQLAGGGEVPADLVVVAEGRHSRLRESLGIEAHARLVSFTAAPLVPDTELPSPALGHVFLGAPGPVLAYGIGGRHVRMCIDLPRDAERGPAAMQRALVDSYAQWVPEPLRSAMLQSWRNEPPEICANHEIHTERCVVPGLALVGDAGGCSHPMTATGITSGLNDVQTIARALREERDIDEALDRYQRERYDFVRTREILAEGLYDFFLGAEPSTQSIRDGIFDYWSADPGARAASMSLLSGDDSRLRTLWAIYLRVFAHTTWCAMRAMPANASLRQRGQAFLALCDKSVDKLGRMARAKYRNTRY